MAKLEIERKFLLKSLPNVKHDDVLKIDQYYFKNSKGIWERARVFQSEVTGEYSYIHTIKKTLSKSVNIEEERDLTKDEFEDFKKKCLKPKSDSRHISKDRWIYNDGDLKWEVDVFKSGYNLIIAELEIPTKKHIIVFPSYINDVKLLEVTGLKQFSNRALSLKIIKND